MPVPLVLSEVRSSDVSVQLTIEPRCAQWAKLLTAEPSGQWQGDTLSAWRRRTRHELGLAVDRPIIATGHQTLLWHPGILVKYLLVNAIAADLGEVATANLVVDQHVGAFSQFEIPVRGDDGALAVKTVTLAPHRDDVPMARHRAFTPPQAPRDLPGALPSVRQGVDRIFQAVAAHAGAPNAALQMAAALAELMSPWVDRMPNVTASDLVQTTLARSILQQMAQDPKGCIETYNAAVDAVPEGGIGRLEGTGDAVELPIWRVGADDIRRRGRLGDLRAWVETESPTFAIMPRALFMTALVRLGMCDLFVHGTSGARYDRAMELWVSHWLGLEPAPIVVATATQTLPLGPPPEQRIDVAGARRTARKLWHDPQSAADAAGPGSAKRSFLGRIETAPRRSAQRRALFHELHECLAELRRGQARSIEAAQGRVAAAVRQAHEAPIVDRRTWSFPLYPQEMIDQLAQAVREAVVGAEASAVTASRSPPAIST
ncbi:MAG: hypothetical protein IIC46_02320 [Planctomycetes bacterium]|nr:hypothetical protein [Planctomycetota bacterium]